MIEKIINSYRSVKANKKFLEIFFNTLTFYTFLFLLLSLLEFFLYFEQSTRAKLFLCLHGILILTISYSVVKWVIVKKGYFYNYLNIEIAKEIGKNKSLIKDELLNVLQLQKNKTNEQTLVELAKRNVENKLKNIYPTLTNNVLPINTIQRFVFILIITIPILTFTVLKEGSNRIINYTNVFEVPKPFTLQSTKGSFSALQGDTIRIDFSGNGILPDSIDLYWEYDDILNHNRLSIDGKNNYGFIFKNLSKNIYYWAEYENPKIFKKWDKIVTSYDTIKIKSRPVIKNISFSINPPEYTNEKKYIHNYSNITQLELLKGTVVDIELEANKTLTAAWMLNNNERINLDIEENKIKGNFIIQDDMKFTVYCMDQNYIPNINPLQYTFIAINDNSPNILINEPEKNFEIDESFLVPLSLNVIDDINISKVWIEFAVLNNMLNEGENDTDTLNIYNGYTNNKNILIQKKWDISNLNILMGDELHFHFFAKDNNIELNNVTQSDLYIGRFPSLENIFSEIEKQESNTEDWIEDIKDTIENITEKTEDIKLDLLKSDDITWEQKKQLEETFSEIEEISNQIQEIKENIEKITEQAEKNNIFSDNLLEKFEKFQEMLDDIMTPELLDAIEKLQDSFQNANMKQLMDALENYEFNVEKFEEQIDRFIDMFELALAEQKLNEVAEHIENMINKQTQLIKDIKNKEDEYILNKKSNKQESRFSDLKSLLNEASFVVENISENTKHQIEDLLSDNIIKDTEETLSKQTSDITESNQQSASKNCEGANENLKDIANHVQQIIEEFNNENKAKMSKEFIIIINSLFTMSNQQENLIMNTYGVRSNSPKIREINQNQFNIDKELNQITNQLIDLSNKTFFVNPKINRVIGRLKSSINKTISYFEQKQISLAKKEQQLILDKINEITLLLLLSMEEMENSESVSGFEQFMKSLEEMSGQQQGINQGTMQLGQLGMMQQQQMMQQLQGQQEHLKQKLEELIGNNPGEDPGGGLHKSTEDMEDIINDFKNKNVTQKTIERQQKILSRMLDSQKSLQQKDFNNKRESFIADDIDFKGPSGLPDDMGEKDLLLMNALDNAMDEELSTEYEKLLQRYFLNLQKESTEK